MADSSVVRSEFKTDPPAAPAVQTAEMVMAANGDLLRYEWNETSPTPATAVVEPQKQLLVQHITGGPTVKAIDQQYILPSSTVILDDYFFSQREVLAWRYLGENCHTDQRGGCNLPRAQFGALIPRQRTSTLVNLEYVGHRDRDRSREEARAQPLQPAGRRHRLGLVAGRTQPARQGLHSRGKDRSGERLNSVFGSRLSVVRCGFQVRAATSVPPSQLLSPGVVSYPRVAAFRPTHGARSLHHPGDRGDPGLYLWRARHADRIPVLDFLRLPGRSAGLLCAAVGEGIARARHRAGIPGVHRHRGGAGLSVGIAAGRRLPAPDANPSRDVPAAGKR